MSQLYNLAGIFMPHFEDRRVSASLAVVNAELVLDVNGDNNATIYLDGGAGSLTGTFVFEGAFNGVDYYPLLAFPYTPGCLNGTVPVAGQPLISEAFSATANIKRTYCLAVGGLQKIRVRASALSAGSAAINMIAGVADSISPYVRDQKAATLMQSGTAAAGAAVTVTLPAVPGLRHYVDRIAVNRSMTVAQTASATPTLVTTTNLPGTPALTFGTDAAAIGQDREQVLEFGGAGMAASAAGTATTVVCPVLAGAIWRVNVAYRLGI